MKRQLVFIRTLTLSLIIIPILTYSQTKNDKSVQIDIKDLPRLYLEEVVNEQKLDILHNVFSADYVFHEMNGTDNYSIKSGGLRSFLQSFFKAFPDINYKIDLMIAESDKVALYCTATGTNKNDFLGIKAVGNKVTFKEIFIFRVKNERIVEGWGVVDVLGVQNQIRGN